MPSPALVSLPYGARLWASRPPHCPSRGSRSNHGVDRRPLMHDGRRQVIQVIQLSKGDRGDVGEATIAAIPHQLSCITAFERLDCHATRYITSCELNQESEPERRGVWWRGLDSNQRRRTPADLQSAPFSHSGTPPLTGGRGLKPNAGPCQRTPSRTPSRNPRSPSIAPPP